MPQYLVANYLPDDFDPSTVTEAMIEEIHALNREMIAAGVRKFACGISPAGSAKTLRAQPDGKVLVTDGPYTETKEHMGGFWILEAADMDEALAWARKAVSRLRGAGRGAWGLPKTGGSNRAAVTIKQNQIGLERNSVMRKIIVLEFVSLDGVIQAPGGPEEDTSGGFAYGGWIASVFRP